MSLFYPQWICNLQMFPIWIGKKFNCLFKSRWMSFVCLLVCLGFYAISTVFQLLNGHSSQIHVSWTTFDQHLSSQLSWHWRTSLGKTTSTSFNSLPHNKILDQSNFRAFSDGKKNVTKKLKYVLERVENIVGKGENAGYQHLLLFPQCFLKASFPGSSKVGIVW